MLGLIFTKYILQAALGAVVSFCEIDIHFCFCILSRIWNGSGLYHSLHWQAQPPTSATMPTPSLIRKSIPLPPHVYEGEEYFCRFTPRIHRDARLADAGSWQCQADFFESSTEARADANRNKDVVSYAVGCINPIVGNFTALCACEALSGRLALTTYMVEYAYIHDDGNSVPMVLQLATRPRF